MKTFLLLISVTILSCNISKNAWLIEESRLRQEFIVNAGAVDRFDAPVELELDKLRDVAQNRSILKNFRLIEVTSSGEFVQAIHQVQLDADTTSARAMLTFVLLGETKAGENRFFQIYFGNLENPQPLQLDPVTVETAADHEGQESFKITTQNSTYYYHIRGAGFASWEDNDGNDWLSYNPGVGAESNSGSGGMYRGLPNMGYPEGYCHPGKEESTSWLVHRGPIKVTIQSESNDNKMKCQWDIFPHFARLTVIRMRTPYWFLYEGTPGGTLEMDSDFCVRPGNVRTLCSESWEGDIQSEDEGEWLYFGDVQTNRVLYLVQHIDDRLMDSYWPMNEEMTVFGFGRLDLNKFLKRQNNQFTMGLVDTHAYDIVKKEIHSAYQPLETRRGKIAKR